MTAALCRGRSKVTVSVSDIPPDEITITAIRASGPGGQNVNKVASAIHLRFDVGASSLAPEVKHKLTGLSDSRISEDGVIVIKDQRLRSQERNREDALARLDELLARAQHIVKTRRATRPSKSAVRRRVDHKVRRGRTKKDRATKIEF